MRPCRVGESLVACENDGNHVALKIEQADVGAEPVSSQTRQLLVTQLATAGLSVLDENLVVALSSISQKGCGG